MSVKLRSFLESIQIPNLKSQEIDKLIDRFVDRSINRFVDRSSNQLIDELIINIISYLNIILVHSSEQISTIDYRHTVNATSRKFQSSQAFVRFQIPNLKKKKRKKSIPNSKAPKNKKETRLTIIDSLDPENNRLSYTIMARNQFVPVNSLINVKLVKSQT